MTNKIAKLFKELENNIPFYASENSTASAASVGWHIEHSLLTFDGIIGRLVQSNSNDYKPKFSLAKLFVFATSTIPKGRLQSPESVRPKGDITPETLNRHLSLTKEKVKKLNSLNPKQFFEHPYFGHLRVKEAVKFLEIHTKHHLKIIHSIKN